MLETLGILGKEMLFFEKTLKMFSKTLSSDTFLQKAFQKLFLLMQSPNVQNLMFWKTNDVFYEKNLERHQEHYSHFLSRMRVTLSCCSGILKTINLLGFWTNRCCFRKDPNIFPKSIGKLKTFKLLRTIERTENVQQLEISEKVDG